MLTVYIFHIFINDFRQRSVKNSNAHCHPKNNYDTSVK